MKAGLAAVFGFGVMMAAGGPSAAFGPFGDEAPRLNDVQVIGSHNSYKRAISAAVMARIAAGNPGLAASLAYSHLPLQEQLDIGVRQLEIDVFADPDGGRFASPLGAAIAAGSPDAPPVDKDALARPGFKVFHIQDLDYGSHCALFTACLETVRAWSDAHPKHLPIVLTINPKTEEIGVPGATQPLPFTAETFDALDSEIRSVLAADRLISPDAVRGGHITLEAAILTDGWPTLEASRGKIMVILDAPAALADLYRKDHKALRGRAMFASYPAGSPEAAALVMNDPVADGDKIRRLVARGYIVRTRSDADTAEARAADRGRFEAAMASGAQIISTDYYPGAPDPLNLGFEISFAKSRLIACNPIRTETSCSAGSLEPRKYRQKRR